MTTWQQRMETRVERLRLRILLSGACGWCTDEGSQHRSAVFEYSRLDALAVARTGYLGEYAASHANSKDVKKQKDVSDFLADPKAAKRAGVAVAADVTERRLAKAEFFARRAAGVDQLLPHGRFPKRRDAELEWMKREAEVETGFRRDDPNPVRRSEFQAVYDRLRAHDFR